MSKTYEALRKIEERRARAATSGGTAASGGEPPGVLARVSSRERVEYQKVRVWLTNATARGEEIRSVMVVSCRASTGSTTTATLLASTLAEGKRWRVLIVDGNLRTPTLNLVFNVRANGGFSDVVTEGAPPETRIQPTDRPNLSVLTTGEVAVWPAEIFEGKAIDDVLEQFKQRFDFVIFDAAPVLEFPDACSLAPKVDGIILVVRCEGTTIDEATQARRRLEAAGGRMLGVVLNGQRDYTPKLLRRLIRS